MCILQIRKNDSREKLEKEKENKRNEIKKMFLFGMAYAANIGGTAVRSYILISQLRIAF